MNGKDVEERVRNKLETFCEILHDPTYDHQYKVDFIVTKFKGVFKLPPQIGVQVTTRSDDVRKQSEFLRISQQGIGAPRNVFLEVDPQVNLDGGAAQVLCFALGTFAYSRQYQDVAVIGLRIAQNSLFEFFDLEENVQRLREKSTDEMVGRETQGDALEGGIFKYDRGRGFGFIKHTYSAYRRDFFFHFSNAQEEMLHTLRNLDTIADGSKGWAIYNPPIEVAFEDGGYVEERDNPQAINVRLKGTEFGSQRG